MNGLINAKPTFGKADLARRLKVSKAMISHLVRDGLPVLEDGRIDFEVAKKWASQCLRQPWIDRFEAADVRSAPIQNQPGAEIISKLANPRDYGFMMLGLLLLHRIQAMSALSIVDTGGPLKVAYAASNTMVALLWTELQNAAIAAGIEPLASDPEAAIFDQDAAWPVDWKDLAARAGETVDLEAWQAYERSLAAKDGAAE